MCQVTYATFHVFFTYINSSSTSQVSQDPERSSDAHSPPASTVRSGIQLQPVWVQGCTYSFHDAQGSQAKCLSESRKNNASGDSWALHPIYWIRISAGAGGGAANVCLGIYFKSSQGPADDQPSVGSLHCIHSTHTVPPEEHESGDERGPHSVAVLTYSGGLLPRAATTGLPCVFSTEWYTFLVSQLYCGVPCIWQNVCQAVPTEFI